MLNVYLLIHASLQSLDVYDSALQDEGDVDEALWKHERKRNHSEIEHGDMSDGGEGFACSSALASQSYKKRRVSETTSLLPAFQIGETPREHPNRFMVRFVCCTCVYATVSVTPVLSTSLPPGVQFCGDCS